MSVWDRDFREHLEHLESAGRLRRLQPVTGAQQPVLVREGKELLNLSSNNYLGLADHPRLREAAGEALNDGVGSRLLD